RQCSTLSLHDALPILALKTTYLNDVRFDLRPGKAGVAYITDSSLKGQNGIIVVDLATGKSRRRLHAHASTLPDRDFLPLVEGRPDRKSTRLNSSHDQI